MYLMDLSQVIFAESLLVGMEDEKLMRKLENFLVSGESVAGRIKIIGPKKMLEVCIMYLIHIETRMRPGISTFTFLSSFPEHVFVS